MSMASFEDDNFNIRNDGSLSREDVLAMEGVSKVKTDTYHTYIVPEERSILGDDFTGEFISYTRVEGSNVVQLGSRVQIEQEIPGGGKIKYLAIIFSKDSFDKTSGIYDGHDVIPYTSPLGFSILGHRPGEECIVRISEGKYTTVKILSVEL